MRLRERYKRTVYIQNETYWNSGEFTDPYKLRFIITPKSDRFLHGGGTDTLLGTVELKIESNKKGLQEITENSLVWIDEVPNETSDNHTHNIIGKTLTSNGWYMTVDCKAAKPNAR